MDRRTFLVSAGALVSLTGRAYCASQIQIFRSIHYGSAGRFGLARVLPYIEAERDDRGPIAPQRPARLELATGPMAPLKQEENCQVLSVFTPSRAGKRPVMAFLHGGAFIAGGGDLPWHDGDKLAAEGDVVVVSITYRLGALGFFIPPNTSGPSPGISDQIAALQWIKDNIIAFGGDPDNVTIFGHSAGGSSVANLVAWGYGGKLFHRAILQSGTGRAGGGRPRAQVEQYSAEFASEVLMKDPKSASVEEILEAQTKFIAQRGGDIGWSVVAPEKVQLPNVPVICGWTSEDDAPFLLIAGNKRPDPAAELTAFREATKNGLAKTVQSFTEQVTKAGQRAYLFEFAWRGPRTGLGNCHTIELPFLLGSQSAWSAAPMLKGADWNDVERLGRQMRMQWASFARSGDPAAAGGPAWKTCSADSQPVNRLA